MQEMTFSVNCLFGQKHLASLLDVHLGARFSQVLMHWGTVLGQGDEGAGLELEAGEVPVEPVPAGVVMVSGGVVCVALAEHLVQMVEVEVRVMVETVLVGTVTVDPPVVIVLVTGQVVTVVYVTRVVVDSSGTAGVEPALTLEGAGLDTAGLVSAGIDPAGVDSAGGIVPPGTVVTPAEHLVQIVEVEVIVTVEIVLDVVTM